MNSIVRDKINLIYRLDNINSDDGVDIFEIAPILMNFGELIRNANNVLGNHEIIDVRVKPFQEGSWITEFIFQAPLIDGLLQYLQSDDGNKLMLIIAFLGFDVKSGITSVADIIRFTKGKVDDFTFNESKSKVKYFDGMGGSIEVEIPVHRLVQSPLIQNNYYNGVLSPYDKFPTVGSVSIGRRDEKAQVFTTEDKMFFEEYCKTTLFEDIEENPILMNGVYLKPKRGSYTGEDKAYSFYMGDSILYPTTIEDLEFLEKLKLGDVRLFQEDVLLVDLEIRQKKDQFNKVVNHYAIKKVLNYLAYERPKQLKFQ